METLESHTRTIKYVHERRIPAQTHPPSHASNWHTNLRGTLAITTGNLRQTLVTRIDHHIVRKRPRSRDTIQTMNTSPEKNKKAYTQSKHKDNGGMEIPEYHLLHHPHQPGPRHTLNSQIRPITTSHTSHKHDTT